MAWEDCVTSLKKYYQDVEQKDTKDFSEVNWSTNNEAKAELNKDKPFAVGDPFYLVCPQRHCNDNVDQTANSHKRCSCTDVNGNPLPASANCQPIGTYGPVSSTICFNVDKFNINDINTWNFKSGRNCINQPGNNWYEVACTCCCSCFAYGTRIGTPEGLKVIEQFIVGDKVLTADIEPNGTGVKLNWSSAKVNFSSGTGPDSQEPAMVYIHHGEVGSIVVTPDHLFLMSNGKLKRADRLIPGQDQLVSAEGQSVAINEVSIGEYRGGVHHIATDKEFTGDLNGHLLISEGVVSGDFNLQIHASQLKEDYFVDDHDNLPKIGTSEYESLNTHLAPGNYMTFMTVDKANTPSMAIPKPRKFYVHGEHTCSVPETAAKYLSDGQELDVNDKADKQSFSEVGIGNASVKYVIKLFQGFYPDIVFYHDVGRLEPNAYAFEQYGKNIVVLSGGLTRIKALGLQGMALILSHLVARLQKIEPLDDNGYTSVGMADYFSAGILSDVFLGNEYQRFYIEGLKQIKDSIFSHIDKQHDKYEEDPYQPSIETRVDALNAGDSSHNPPSEIGGPVEGGLQVTGASVLPPQLQPNSLITDDIDSQMAQAVYQQLQENKILDAQGILNAEFSLDSDLSFLFPDKADNLRQLLREEIRYVLLHAGDSIQVTFNIAVDPKTAVDGDDYVLEPAAKVSAAKVNPDNPSVVVLTAKLERNVEYTLTVANYVRAAGGSTLDPETNTAKFKLA